jgi:rubrerythrin
MAAEARAEGFEEIARHFENVAKVEARHEARYLKLLANVKGGEVFAKPGRKLFWACRNCGFVHEGEAAPATCPACKHPQAYFEIKADNF